MTSIGQYHSVGHSHVATKGQGKWLGFHRQCGCGQTTIKGNAIGCVAQHHAGVGSHGACEGGGCTVHHLQRFQWCSTTHGSLQADGGSVAAIQRQAACTCRIAIHVLHKRDAAARIHLNIGEDFHDVVEHGISGRVDDRTLEVSLT